jgi:hypothetical protein
VTERPRSHSVRPAPTLCLPLVSNMNIDLIDGVVEISAGIPRGRLRLDMSLVIRGTRHDRILSGLRSLPNMAEVRQLRIVPEAEAAYLRKIKNHTPGSERSPSKEGHRRK